MRITCSTVVCKSLGSKSAVVIQHWPIRTITNDITSILIGHLQIFKFCSLTNDLQTTVSWVTGSDPCWGCFGLGTRLVSAGNHDEDYVALVEQRGGTVRNVNGLTTAYIDRNEKEPTVQHQNCHLLTAAETCSVCHQYQNTLRALKSKEKTSDTHKKEQRTEHSSHTNWYLTKEEPSKHLENLQKAKRALTRRN